MSSQPQTASYFAPESTPTTAAQRAEQNCDVQPPISPRFAWYMPIKHLVDFVGGLALLLMLSPVILVCAALVKVTSRGPAFYCQTRVGKAGRLFKLIKLRSMVQNAEAKTGAVWTQPGDSRITTIGRILRKTHLDEFPQLINVVLGHMSLVGPRPERPEFVNTLEFEFAEYAERHRVRPGITGLAQLQLPPDSDLEGVRVKLIHDLYYIRHASPWFDARIIAFTGWLFVSTFLQSTWKRIRMPLSDQVNESLRDVVAENSQLLTAQWDQ